MIQNHKSASRLLLKIDILHNILLNKAMNYLLALISFIFSFNLFSSSLHPVLLDSPQNTFKTYLLFMNEYTKAHEAKDEKKKAFFLKKASLCFDLKDFSYFIQSYQGEKAALLLKEVLDRYIHIDLKRIPDDSSLNYWRLKGTEIYVQKLKHKEKDVFKFSSDSIKKLSLYYDQLKHKNYLGNLKGSFYEESVFLQMSSFLPQKSFMNIQYWQWALIILAIIFSFLLNVVLKLLVYAISLVKKESDFKHFEKPVFFIFLSILWFFVIESSELKKQGFEFLGLISLGLFNIAIAWFFYSLTYSLERVLNRFENKINYLDPFILPLTMKAVRVIIFLFGSLLVIQSLGFNVISLMAGLGLGGLALALAAKDSASNFFGSLMIFLDQPFKVGDVVETGSVAGTVVQVGFRSTRIKTFYDSVVSIPNSVLATQNIDNLTRRKSRRVKSFLGLTYDTKPEKIQEFVAQVKDFLKNHHKVDSNNIQFSFYEYADSSLNLMLYFFIQTDDYSEELKIREEIFLNIYKIAEKLSVEFAFPTRTVYMKKDN